MALREEVKEMKRFAILACLALVAVIGVATLGGIASVEPLAVSQENISPQSVDPLDQAVCLDRLDSDDESDDSDDSESDDEDGDGVPCSQATFPECLGSCLTMTCRPFNAVCQCDTIL